MGVFASVHLFRPSTRLCTLRAAPWLNALFAKGKSGTFRPPDTRRIPSSIFPNMAADETGNLKVEFVEDVSPIANGGGGPWPLISMISPSTHWPLTSLARMRSGVVIVPILWRLTFGSLRWYQDLGRGKVQLVGWDLAIIFNIWDFGISVGYHFGIWWSFEILAFLMIFHINYSIAMCAAAVYLVHRNLEVSKTASSIDMDQYWQEAQIVDSIRDLTWSHTCS